jgi:hypothetical protein
VGILKAASDWWNDPEKPGEVRVNCRGRQAQLSDVEDLCRQARAAGASDNALFQSPTARDGKDPAYISIVTTKAAKTYK